MRLSVDPMPALRAARKERINAAFNAAAAHTAHLDQAYAQKREWAKAQDARLTPEAELRGITVAELSDLILSKSDTLAERELRRQSILAKIEKAKTPAELESIFVDI